MGARIYTIRSSVILGGKHLGVVKNKLYVGVAIDLSV